MKITIAQIKQIAKKKMFSYANCALSTKNAYYINDGAIKNAKSWFKDFAELKSLESKTVASMEKYFKDLEQKYL